MSARKVSSMTEDELVAVVRSAVRAEFSAAGLRVDAAADQDEAKEDFRFLRRVRRGVDGAASKVGMAIILAIVSGVMWLVWAGFQAVLPPK